MLKKLETLNSKAVRKWMIDNEIPQWEFARLLDMTEPYLSQMLNGRVPLTGAALLRFHDVTSIPYDELRSAEPPKLSGKKKQQKPKPPKRPGRPPAPPKNARKRGVS